MRANNSSVSANRSGNDNPSTRSASAADNARTNGLLVRSRSRCRKPDAPPSIPLADARANGLMTRFSTTIICARRRPASAVPKSSCTMGVAQKPAVRGRHAQPDQRGLRARRQAPSARPESPPQSTQAKQQQRLPAMPAPAAPHPAVPPEPKERSGRARQCARQSRRADETGRLRRSLNARPENQSGSPRTASGWPWRVASLSAIPDPGGKGQRLGMGRAKPAGRDDGNPFDAGEPLRRQLQQGRSR